MKIVLSERRWLRLRKALRIRPDPNQHADAWGDDCARCGTGMLLEEGCEWGKEGTDVCNSCAQSMVATARAIIFGAG
jgi:hypothetical protein